VGLFFDSKDNAGSEGHITERGALTASASCRTQGTLQAALNGGGIIAQKIPTKDLYYLKRICDDAKHFSKRFWWGLNAQQSLRADRICALDDTGFD
jgi:hypothetical protein